MPNKVKVKSYIRKGRVVKSFDRNNKTNIKTQTKTFNTAKNVGLGVAGLVGISVATYGGLKYRYINRLNTFAKNLKVTEQVVPTNKKHLTFTIGGFGIHNKPNTSSAKQSDLIGRIIKTLNKDQEVINLDHNLLVPKIPTNPKEHGLLLLKKFSEPILNGKNSKSEELAQQIYNHAKANPGKAINMTAFSAGGNVGKDIQYILHKKGITTKLVTAGSPDFRFVPSNSNSLHITSKHDLTNILKSTGSHSIDEIKEHRPDAFYRNKKVKQLVKNFLYSDV